MKFENKTKDILVSVIIPIFNAEKYLSQCIESLLNIKEISLELILVNDGSTDASRLMIDDYAKKDTRIKAIHAENGGVSVARNRGIKLAKGRYVWFVDADDIVNGKVLSTINSYLDKNIIIDLFQFNYAPFKESVNEVSEPFNQNQPKLFQDNLEYFNSGSEIFSIWRCLFKRKILVQYNLEFLPNLKFGEDLLFTFIYTLHVKNILTTQELGYYYRIHSDSVMNSKHTTNDALNHLTIIEYLTNILDKDMIVDDYLLNVISTRIIKTATSMIAFSSLSSSKIDLKKIQSEYNNYYDSAIKTKKYKKLSTNLRLKIFRVSILPYYYLFIILNKIGLYKN